ncbi:hypothetical protein Vadar_026366 [Vaccinium darrowii]|uniref:Uncharacterized protein n=1 Tax=Vaccinium darrowii TaxID=229202 RepID=A0ACB7YQD5_9ERIC|nr:hypothetical protein Vadar_026366 [Vaccinium darrowii]
MSASIRISCEGAVLGNRDLIISSAFFVSIHDCNPDVLAQILQLLRFSLVSKTPLTYWMQLKQGITFPTELEAKDFGELLDTEPANSESKKMDLKLFFSKCRNEVLYAESGEDFVDFLFSFLTFPLGSILKLLGGKSSLGCVDNLYSSVQNLSTNNYLQSEEIERMLLSPKHAPFSACESQLLDIEESVNTQYIVDSCSNCNSFEGIFSGPLSLVNPKSTSGETTGGGGFVKGPVKFMVTDALAVTLLSPTSITSYLADLNVPITDVGKKDVRVGKNEALNLLKMALVSGKALTNVFNLGDGQSEHNSRVCNPSCFKMCAVRFEFALLQFERFVRYELWLDDFLHFVEVHLKYEVGVECRVFVSSSAMDHCLCCYFSPRGNGCGFSSRPSTNTSFTSGSFPATSPSPLSFTLSAPPLHTASSTPTFSDFIAKVPMVTASAGTNGILSRESCPPPNDSHKKVSTSAPDSAPQTTTLPVKCILSF